MRATIDRTLLTTTAKRFPAGSTVVEIGCIRNGSRLGLRGDGHSTLKWAKAGFRVYAVDVNAHAVSICGAMCAEYANVSVVHGDGLRFLGSFSGEIDILYLDAMGPEHPKWKEKHLEMFLAGKDKLSSRGVVIVDDVDVLNLGKGELIMNSCREHGFDYSVHGSMCLIERSSRPNKGKTVLAGPWVGEFGWELFCWQGYLRRLHRTQGLVIDVMGRPGHEALYDDFCRSYIAKPIPSGGVMCWHNNQFADKEDIDLGRGYDLHIRPQTNPPVRYDLRKPCGGAGFPDQIFVQLGRRVPSNRTPGIILHARDTAKCGSANRNWPERKWLRLRDKLGELGRGIGCMGSKDAALHLPGTRDLRGIPLGELADVLASADLVIGPSSGPMHLASLCGTPQLVWSVDKNRKRYLKDWNPFETPVVFLSRHGWDPPMGLVYRKAEAFLLSHTEAQRSGG